MSTAERVLSTVADVADVEEVQRDPDLRLYELGILDSLKTVELIAALSDVLGVEITLTEFDRDEWATPRQIVDYFERRVGP